MKTTGLPQFNPLQQQQRVLETQGKVQQRALELLEKSRTGTIGQDAGVRDMMETQAKWMRSDALQQFNPMNLFRGGMTVEQQTLAQLGMRAQLGDGEAAVQLQQNFAALQSLALGARVGVSFEQVRGYLFNAAAQALMNGDHATFQNHTQALAGLEAAAALIPGYEQAARSIPTHKKEKGTGPLPTGTRDHVQGAAQAVRGGLDAAREAHPVSAEVAALLRPDGVLTAPKRHQLHDRGWVDLSFDRGTVQVAANGLVSLDSGRGPITLSSNDQRAVLRGVLGWAHDPRISSPRAVEKVFAQAMTADIPPAKRQALREAKSQLVDARPNIVKANIDDGPHPLAARVRLHDVELVKTPKAAAQGTLLVDPLEGHVRMRTAEGKLYDVAKDDVVRVYQSLRAHSNPPAGFDAFMDNLEAAIIRGRQA